LKNLWIIFVDIAESKRSVLPCANPVALNSVNICIVLNVDLLLALVLDVQLVIICKLIVISTMI
jgi:hypothetical protein